MLGLGHLQVVPVELRRLGEADDVDALAVLAGPELGVQDLPVDVVPELVPQHVHDHPEGVPPVVAREVLHVLQEERPWPLGVDARHLEEQGSLSLVLEARGAPERALLGDPGERERLAGEAGEQHVEVLDVIGGNLADVTGGRLPVVHPVSLLGEPVPLAGEHASAA